MPKTGINLKIEGFEDILKDIEASGRSMESAVESCIRQSAKTVDSELRAQLRQATESDLADRMPPPEIEVEGNRVTAFVGFHKGAYNPENPSDGYRALFLNYGTPHRTKHGKESARGFITVTKKKVARTLKKQQKETFNKILSRLKK